MSKVLVVFYSHTGTSRKVAQLLCEQHGWTLAEITDELPRRGLPGYLRSVLDSMLRRHPPIRYDGPLPKSFDAVVLVSPIWAWRLASPMRSFVMRRQDHLPDVAVVSVMGGGGAANAVDEVSRILGRAPLLHAAFTQREVESGSHAQRLQSFGEELVRAEGAPRPVHPITLSRQTA
ncbi:flavodoxin [Variovorax humicola]|uniref:Flavodoxin n=1 Tax=Variovorax humicola TaxID=1769758 RepID=A0ABU8WAA9_9BURK